MADGSPPRERVSVSDADAVGAPLRYRIAAMAGFAFAVPLLRLPFRLQLTLLDLIAHRRGGRATHATSATLLAIVRRYTRRWPGWVHCLELSVATFLAGAILGEAPDWCLGVRFRPPIRHAWIEVGGKAIDTNHDPGPYHALVHIRSNSTRRGS